MEEDAGKLVHDEWGENSLVDFNRSGVPLIEIVSEPDMRSASEVICLFGKAANVIQYLGASDCKLQEGSMRADVNLSVREVGAAEFGTRTEMKNLNSFKAIARAIESERERQIDLIEAGKEVVQETRRWVTRRNILMQCVLRRMLRIIVISQSLILCRIIISDEWLDEIRARQPELQEEKLARYMDEYKLPEYDAKILNRQ